MGDAQHLLAAADAGHLLRHLLGGTAADAGIHLIEHQRAHLILLTEHVFHGQHDAGQLTAGGDPVDRPQLLAHVGGHQEPHLVHAIGAERLLCDVHGEPDPAHVQLPQLLQDLGGQPLRRLPPPLGQSLRRADGFLLRLAQLPLQLCQRITGVLDLLQLGAAALQIGQHVLHAGAVLLFQAIQLVQAALHIVQLVGREIEALPLVLDGGCHIVGFAVQRLQPLVQASVVVVQMPYRAYGVLRPPQHAQRTIAAVVAVEGVVCLGHGGGKLLRIAQQVPPRSQFLFLAGVELRPLQLVDLVGQGIYAARFFRFVHL